MFSPGVPQTERMKFLSHRAGISFREMQLNGLLSNKLNTAAAVIAQEFTYHRVWQHHELVFIISFRAWKTSGERREL